MKVFDLFEIYDYNLVLEVCEICLRIRVFSATWIKPEESVLAFFISMKKYHTLTECPDCLSDNFAGKIKL